MDNTIERSVKKSLESIAESLNDIRGMMGDMAPVKTLGSDGEIVSRSSGFMEEMIRKAMLDRENVKTITKVSELRKFVSEKNSYVLSTKEASYVLKVVEKSLGKIEDELKER